MKRRRARKERIELPSSAKHAFSVKYFIPSVTNNKRIPVCKENFLSINKFGRIRLVTIIKKVNSGDAIAEHRGGDRKSRKSIAKKEKVREFISGLHATESHYNRKNKKRVYLSSQCSIRKLHNSYHSTLSDEEGSVKISFSMFRDIFRNEFNIGFRTPESDVCSQCLLIKEKLK